MKRKQRIDYLDYLRLVAIFGVITVHVATSLNFYHQDYAGLNWQILNFWDGLSRFCVPVFIMISGALFSILILSSAGTSFSRDTCTGSCRSMCSGS